MKVDVSAVYLRVLYQGLLWPSMKTSRSELKKLWSRLKFVDGNRNAVMIVTIILFFILFFYSLFFRVEITKTTEPSFPINLNRRSALIIYILQVYNIIATHGYWFRYLTTSRMKVCNEYAWVTKVEFSSVNINEKKLP
jgi:hypothetical protein